MLNSTEEAHLKDMSTFASNGHLQELITVIVALMETRLACAPLSWLSKWASKADTSAMAFVFEGDFDLGAVELNLAVAENHVLRHDFRYAQLAKCLPACSITFLAASSQLSVLVPISSITS